MGTNIFGNAAVGNDPLSNRNLLLEVCCEHELQVLNSFFDRLVNRSVTYFGWGVDRHAEINYKDFA